MKLVVDVGNTNIALGVYIDNKITAKGIFETEKDLNKDGFNHLLFAFINKYQINPNDNQKTIYASVVPELDKAFISSLEDIFKQPITRIKYNTIDLKIDVDDPKTIGDDLLADLLGAKNKYPSPCLIADLGTASKLLILDQNQTFIACSFMAGIHLMNLALSHNASLLNDINLKAPESVLAKNTEDALNVGLLIGHAEMINGLTKRYEKELGYPLKKILTGGNAIYIKELLPDFIYDENLVLDGLNDVK